MIRWTPWLNGYHLGAEWFWRMHADPRRRERALLLTETECNAVYWRLGDGPRTEGYSAALRSAFGIDYCGTHCAEATPRLCRCGKEREMRGRTMAEARAAGNWFRLSRGRDYFDPPGATSPREAWEGWTRACPALTGTWTSDEPVTVWRHLPTSGVTSTHVELWGFLDPSTGKVSSRPVMLFEYGSAVRIREDTLCTAPLIEEETLTRECPTCGPMAAGRDAHGQLRCNRCAHRYDEAKPLRIDEDAEVQVAVGDADFLAAVNKVLGTAFKPADFPGR